MLDLTIQKQHAVQQAGEGNIEQGSQQSSSSPQRYPVEQKGEDAPLAREEVAKLLLLVSRAHGIGQLTDEQKSQLKMDICRRKGALRNILRQQDITQIMTVLAQAGSSN